MLIFVVAIVAPIPLVIVIEHSSSRWLLKPLCMSEGSSPLTSFEDNCCVDIVIVLCVEVNQRVICASPKDWRNNLCEAEVVVVCKCKCRVTWITWNCVNIFSNDLQFTNSVAVRCEEQLNWLSVWLCACYNKCSSILEPRNWWKINIHIYYERLRISLVPHELLVSALEHNGKDVVSSSMKNLN